MVPFFGEAGSDILDLSPDSTVRNDATRIHGWTAAVQSFDGGTGAITDVDTIRASADVNFSFPHVNASGPNPAHDTFVRSAPALAKTKTTPAYAAVTSTLTYVSVERSELIGGAHANLLNAKDFVGTTKLIGRGGIDNLIAGQGDSDLYGFDLAGNPAVKSRPAGFSRDNYFISNGLSAAMDQIFATNVAGNNISFRFYQRADSNHDAVQSGAGIAYTLPEKASLTSVEVNRDKSSSTPSLKVSVPRGLLTSVEGSFYNDVLRGSRARPNALIGGSGDDVLTAVGVDVLYGGPGQDTLLGATPYKYQAGNGALTGIAGVPAPYNPNSPTASRLALAIERIAELTS